MAGEGDGGAESRRQIEEQLDAWDVPEEQRAKYLQASDIEAEPFEVYASNVKALDLFLATATQWRTAGMNGAHLGLDYVALDVVARAKGVKLDHDLLWSVQVLEGAAAKEINELLGSR